MTKEQNFFLEVIKNYINEEKTQACENINWELVFSYAQNHQLTAIVYHQCKDFLSPEARERYKDAFYSSITSNIQRKKITDEIIGILKSKGIHCTLVKGYEIAKYYPHWQYRTMGDIDFLVDDKEKTHGVMVKNGFQSISTSADLPNHYSKQNFEFEVHDRLVYQGATYIDTVAQFLNRFKDYSDNGKIDDSFHFIFVLDHLRKHFMKSGVGFRQFIDAAFLIKNDTNIDWNWVSKTLEQIGLLSFANAVLSYIEKWFCVNSPIEIDHSAVDDEDYEKSTQFIFDNGVFGFNNESNSKYQAANLARKSSHPKLAMIRNGIKSVFPSYRSMVYAEKYSFLKGKPILLPLAWVYRLAVALKKKGISKCINQSSQLFVSKEYVANREHMFEKWGIL